MATFKKLIKNVFIDRMHQDRKENKLMLWTEAAASVEAENEEDDWEEEETDDPLHLQHPVTILNYTVGVRKPDDKNPDAILSSPNAKIWTS